MLQRSRQQRTWPRAHGRSHTRASDGRATDEGERAVRSTICNPPFYPGRWLRRRTGRGGEASGGLAFPNLDQVVDRLLAGSGRLERHPPKNRCTNSLDDAEQAGLNPSRDATCVTWRASRPSGTAATRRGERATNMRRSTTSRRADHSTIRRIPRDAERPDAEVLIIHLGAMSEKELTSSNPGPT